MGGIQPAPELCPDMPCGEALRTIAAVRFRELDALLQHPLAEQPDFIHDARVTARRLCALLSVFRGRFRRGRRFRRFGKQLAVLCRVLGKVRECDVNEALAGETASACDAATGLFAARLAEEGAAARVRLLPVMERCTGKRFKKDFTKGVLGALRRKKADRNFSACIRRAAVALSGRLTAGRWPSDPDALHCLRKTGKKLRYTLEVAAAVAGKSFRAPLETVKELVTLLGRVHDIDVFLAAARSHRNALRRFNRSGARTSVALQHFETLLRGFSRQRKQLLRSATAAFARCGGKTALN